MLKLYHHSTSVCSSKVRFVLDEKELKYEGRIVDLLKGEQHTPDYLKLNSKGVVPTLIHDGLVIVESNVICEYLDEVFPTPPLKPESAYDRARMRLWTKQLDEDIHECTSVLSTAIAFRYPRLQMPREKVEEGIDRIPDTARRARLRSVIFEGLDSPHVATALGRFDRLLSDMQTRLESDSWLAGDTFSLADIAIVPYVTRLDHLQLQFMLESRPEVQNWHRRIRARAAYRSSHLQWLEGDMIVDLMQTKGAELRDEVRALVQQHAESGS